MNPSLEEFCRSRLQKLETEGLLRRLRRAESKDGRLVSIEGRLLVHFGSNDYLGLAGDSRLNHVFQKHERCGAGASRLITGNHPAYQELEDALVAFKKVEAALVFSSGYAAALGTIPALVGEKDWIVVDKLCHASLIDAARLSGAVIRVFPHKNLKRCGELLAMGRRQLGGHGKLLLVTESIFSMDGDLAPLADLVDLKKKHGAWLMVDEAHGTGVMGPNGRGGAEACGVEGEIDVSMGTLSKAIGCVGGFICGGKSLRDFLINQARSLIFSTGLPEPVCRSAAAAVRLVEQGSDLRQKLWANVHCLADELGLKAESPIVPIEIGDERRCLAVAETLGKAGFFVPAIRYPTVARKKARLRVSVTAAHKEEDLAGLGKELKKLKVEG